VSGSTLETCSCDKHKQQLPFTTQAPTGSSNDIMTSRNLNIQTRIKTGSTANIDTMFRSPGR
jgi:hypothetical protein